MTFRVLARIVLLVPLAGVIGVGGWMLFALGYGYSNRTLFDGVVNVLVSVFVAGPFALLLFVNWRIRTLVPIALLSTVGLLWFFDIPLVRGCQFMGWKFTCV